MFRFRAVPFLGGVFFLGIACSSSTKHPPPADVQTGAGGGSGVLDAGSSKTGDGATDAEGGSAACYGDNVSDLPKCSWIELVNGDVRTLTAQPETSGVGAPVQVELTAVVPTAKVATADACKALSMGYLLKATDMDETDQPDEGVYWYLIGKDGKWHGAGNGGVSGLVAAFDPTKAPTDGGASRVPTYQFSNHCDDLFKDADAVALVTLMTVIHGIHVGAASYEADFAGAHATDATQPYGYWFAVYR